MAVAVREQLSNLIANTEKTIGTLELGYESYAECMYELAFSITELKSRKETFPDTDKLNRTVEQLKKTIEDHAIGVLRLKKELERLNNCRRQLERGQMTLVEIGGFLNSQRRPQEEVDKKSLKQYQLEFRRKLWQIENPDEAMPEDESDEGSDDEVQMAYEKQTFICPLSQGQFKDPVTSIKCKHTFSREAITAYLRGRNADTCPVPGCNRPMVQSDLKPNKSILRQLSRLNFSQVQTQVADDDEYTVVRPSRSKA